MFEKVKKWKNWPGWLKFGVVIILIIICSYLIANTLGKFTILDDNGILEFFSNIFVGPSLFILIISSLPVYFLNEFLGIKNSLFFQGFIYTPTFYGLIYLSVIYFLAFSFLAYLISKIRKKL